MWLDHPYKRPIWYKYHQNAVIAVADFHFIIVTCGKTCGKQAIKPVKMLLLLIVSVVISMLQQGVGQDINNLSVCVNPESSYLLVEWEPPFPDNADILDVQCSSMNDSFTSSFIVQLLPDMNTTIAVRVPVRGTGVHLGNVYVINATLHTTDGIQIESNPITAVASYFQNIYWEFRSETTVTFRCTISNSCSRVIGGCWVSLIRQTDSHSVNQTVQVLGRKNFVEGTFDNFNASVSYSYNASAVRRDLMTPLGRSLSGVILASNISGSSTNILKPSISLTRSQDLSTSASTSATLTTRKSSSIIIASTSATTRLASSIFVSTVSSIAQSSSLTASSTLLVESTSLVTPRPSTLLERGRSSSRGLPIIGVIGIVCGIVILAAGVIGLALMTLNKLRPERGSSSATRKQRSMFWPFNVYSTQRNGELHPSFEDDNDVGNPQYYRGTADTSTTDTTEYVQMATCVHRDRKAAAAAEYELPIESVSLKTSRLPVKLSENLGIKTIYEVPTNPNQTAYLTEDFKKGQFSSKT